MLNTKNKILSGAALKQKIDSLKNQGKKIVFSNGCFDIIHAGHVDYLEKSRNLGDILIVGVNSDYSIRNIKGPKRPIILEGYRLRLLCGITAIDYVVLFNEPTPYELIKQIVPDVLVKGSDWQDKGGIVGADIVESHGGKVEYMDMLDGISTTGIINKVLENYND